jgi:hypothetical protein
MLTMLADALRRPSPAAATRFPDAVILSNMPPLPSLPGHRCPLKMRFFLLNPVAAAFVVALAIPATASACSSCGCSLSSDWTAQGYAADAGFRVDLRDDYFNQDQMRSGTHAFDRSRMDPANEIQQKTVNRNLVVALDYSPNRDWGINVQVPYFDRFHTTISGGDSDVSTSHTRGLGDVRVIGRYQGYAEDRDRGLEFGLKLPTGAIHEKFSNGPQSGAPIDRGLQPGTGTTDLLLGAYRFGNLSRDWEYFGQALIQQPLDRREDFRPGVGLNVNVGVRYSANTDFTPHIQINTRIEGREAGANADIANSGATRIHLSPGVTVRLSKQLEAYGFVQVPLYLRVNGFQIESRYSVSFGLHYTL